MSQGNEPRRRRWSSDSSRRNDDQDDAENWLAGIRPDPSERDGDREDAFSRWSSASADEMPERRGRRWPEADREPERDRGPSGTPPRGFPADTGRGRAEDPATERGSRTRPPAGPPAGSNGRPSGSGQDSPGYAAP